MKTYTPTNFRQDSYHLINEVIKNKQPVRITVSNKQRLSNQNVYLVNEKTIKEAQEYREMRQMKNGLDKIAKHSHIMNEKEFKHAIGL